MSASLLNKSNVRKYTFQVIAERRAGCAGKMTRVSGEYFDKIEAAVRNTIVNYIEGMPSVGKTVK